MTFLKNKLAVTIIVLSVSFLVLIGYSVKREKVSFVENGVGVTLNSVQKVVYSAGANIKEFGSFIIHFSEIKKENEELKARNDELETKALEYDALKSENERLSENLKFKDERSEFDYLGCRIIGNAGGNYLDGFTIDRGIKDGVKKGMVAVTSKGLVGQVTAVASNWAIIQSLSNENIAVSGMVNSQETSGNDSGMVRGYKDSENRLLAKLYYLPLDSKVKKGDEILTSGLGGLYPKGIRIGKVIDIEEDKGKIMKNAVIEPYVEFNKLQEVMLVVPKNIRDLNEIKY